MVITEQEYRDHPALNQSRLKLLLGNDPSLFHAIEEPDLYFEEKTHFIVGGMVDAMLTQSPQQVEAKYYISIIEEKPSDTMKSIINQAFDQIGLSEDNIGDIGRASYAQAIVDSILAHDYYPNLKTETKLAKVYGYSDYWDELVNSRGKIIVSQAEYIIISAIVMSLKTNDLTAEFFIPNQGNNNIEIRYQVPVFFTLGRIECKGLIDILVINHKDLTVKAYDVKTLSDNTLNFSKSVSRRRYDIQMAFYQEGLHQSEEFENYAVLNPAFIVESTVKPGNPLIYEVSNELLLVGMVGYPEIEVQGVVVKKEIKGYITLLEDYEYYLEHGFDKHIIIQESKGILSLDRNFNSVKL